MQWADRVGRRLKPRDLHVFMAVAEHGNMAKAADSLGISRPVVSKTIAALEHTLGVPLLDRSRHGVEPTLYGRALLKRSIAVFDELRQSVKEIEFLADPNAGELRIGCTEVMAAGIVAAAIDRLSRRYPKLVFQMLLGNAASQVLALRERRCEIVVARQHVPDPEMEVEPLFCEQLVVVGGRRSRGARRRMLALADLVDEPWIQARHEIEPGGPTFEAFAAAGLDIPRVRIISDSLSLRYSLLTTGRFLTMIPGSVLHFGPERAPFDVLPITVPRWRLPTGVITLKNRTLGPAAQLFIDCVRELAKPLAKAV
jgi:DNA-binding transcriptional LysR family regulator